ncbi:MAG: alpha/beta hydrolase [Chloroflexi bacterium]|nr:MAG: alpha/beta hydrolase [Chloroflexota bacterium]
MTTEVLDELEQLKLAATISGVEVSGFVLPDSRHLLVGNMRFHYLDWGAAGRRSVLFLHGGGLNAHTWDLVCLSLRDDYHCLALDLRGHGDSEWSPQGDYAIASHVRDVEGFADQLALKDFVLVGMSLGAVTAAGYAARHSDKLAALVIVDAGPDVQTSGAQKIRDFVVDTATLDSIDQFVEKAVSFNPRRDPRLLRRSLMYNLRATPDGKWMRKNDTRHMGLRTIENMVADSRRQWKGLAAISCPTLVVRGANSDVFRNEDAAKLAQAVPDGRWVTVENAGHTVQGDNPAGLLAALREFFAEAGIEAQD